MTEEEHKELSEKLKKADKILKDIKLIERALKPGARLSIDLYVGSEKGSAMSSLTLTKDLREMLKSQKSESFKNSFSSRSIDRLLFF